MGELSMERFRGIFKLTYNGDAHIVLQTKVQVQKKTTTTTTTTTKSKDMFLDRYNPPPPRLFRPVHLLYESDTHYLVEFIGQSHECQED